MRHGSIALPIGCIALPLGDNTRVRSMPARNQKRARETYFRCADSRWS